MTDKKKSIIYFVLILTLAVAFLTLYLLDNSPSLETEDDSVIVRYESIKPTAISDVNEMEIEVDKDEDIHIYDEIQVIDWDIGRVDSLQILSPRKDFSLIRHNERDWSIRSVRLNERIPSSNNALFKVENVFNQLITNDYYTTDYSELSRYFEYPACTVLVFFKDGNNKKLTFIRTVAVIDEEIPNQKKGQMDTWVRVNDETVVYKTTYNVLARFLVQEQEFLNF